MLHSTDNSPVNAIANTTEILVNIKVAKAKHYQIQCFQKLSSRLISGYSIFRVMLRTIQLYNKFSFGSVKIGYIVHYYHLPVKLH